MLFVEVLCSLGVSAGAANLDTSCACFGKTFDFVQLMCPELSSQSLAVAVLHTGADIWQGTWALLLLLLVLCTFAATTAVYFTADVPGCVYVCRCRQCVWHARGIPFRSVCTSTSGQS